MGKQTENDSMVLLAYFCLDCFKLVITHKISLKLLEKNFQKISRPISFYHLSKFIK